MSTQTLLAAVALAAVLVVSAHAAPLRASAVNVASKTTQMRNERKLNYYLTNVSCMAGAIFPLPLVQPPVAPAPALKTRGAMQMRVSQTANGGTLEFTTGIVGIKPPVVIKGLAQVLNVNGRIRCGPSSTFQNISFTSFLENNQDGAQNLHSFYKASLNSADTATYLSCMEKGVGYLNITYTCTNLIFAPSCQQFLGYAMMSTVRGCVWQRYY